ncbi:MAG: helix-turn-helix domain-containing protein [Pseudonocardiaceae bacterium]
MDHKVCRDHNSGHAEIEAVYLDLGVRFATMRRATGLTQREVAERTGMGRATLANIEKGRQRVLYHQLLDIARALGTDPRELLPPPGSSSPAFGDLNELHPPADVIDWVRRGLAQTGGHQRGNQS